LVEGWPADWLESPRVSHIRPTMTRASDGTIRTILLDIVPLLLTSDNAVEPGDATVCGQCRLSVPDSSRETVPRRVPVLSETLILRQAQDERRVEEPCYDQHPPILRPRALSPLAACAAGAHGDARRRRACPAADPPPPSGQAHLWSLPVLDGRGVGRPPAGRCRAVATARPEAARR